jgi:hypothetical protein
MWCISLSYQWGWWRCCVGEMAFKTKREDRRTMAVYIWLDCEVWHYATISRYVVMILTYTLIIVHDPYPWRLCASILRWNPVGADQAQAYQASLLWIRPPLTKRSKCSSPHFEYKVAWGGALYLYALLLLAKESSSPASLKGTLAKACARNWRRSCSIARLMECISDMVYHSSWRATSSRRSTGT